MEQYSAAHGSIKPWAHKHIVITSCFIPFFILIVNLNNNTIKSGAYFFYFLSFALLVYLFFFGSDIMGASRWIRLKYFNIQPSEMIKISIILVLARYFDSLNHYSINKFISLLPAVFLVSTPVLFIFLQPNFGTCVIIITIALSMSFAAGVGIKKFVIAFFSMLCSAPFIWYSLQSYQKRRIISFLHPDHDPLGSSYNSIQSKVAIGAGGFWGRGFLSGSQSQLNFLPEKQTDFIFTIFLEEFGMFGGILFLTLYGLMLYRIFKIALECNDAFNRLVAVGIGFMIFMHMVLNISMAMGMLPVVGVPLPLVSYGGSMLVNNLLSLSLLINISKNNKTKRK